MKLIIAGSRGVDDYEALRFAMVDSRLWKQHRQSIEVVCGMAQGADALGLLFAESNNLTVHKFPADWDNHGKRAGYLRNAEMSASANACLILWDGQSKGSAHMRDIAIKRGLDTYFYKYIVKTKDVVRLL